MKKLFGNSTLITLRSWHPVPSLHGKRRGKTEAVTDFVFLGSKITVDSDCSLHLLLEKKAMTNLDSVFNSRDVPFLAKVCIVKAMIFPVVIYECESWTIKKAERWKIDAFELWCWRRLFRVPWIARRSKPSVLKKINSQHSLEGLLRKLQYFGYLMQTANSLENTLMLGKIEGKRRRGLQRVRWLDSITDSVDMNLS